MERYGAEQGADGEWTTGFGGAPLADYLAHYYQIRLETYYRRISCPLLLLTGTEEWENTRERAVMEGLRDLAAQAQIHVVEGWEHPYGWLLKPDDVCAVILAFLAAPPPKT
jgi:hypothetical protein